MGHSDRQILKMVRQKVAEGLSIRQAVTVVIRSEGPIDLGRRGYLYREIPRRVERANKRAARKGSCPALTHQYREDTPLPDDSSPLDYTVSDDGHGVVVEVDRFVFEFALTFGVAQVRAFHSLLPNEQLADVGSEIRFEARRLAQECFDQLPKHRKRILRKPYP